MKERPEWPEFTVQEHGKCELCGEEDVDLCCIPDYMWVCQDCFDNDFTMCDVCGQLWVDGAIEFTYLDDGRCVCEYCMEDLDEEDDAEDE